MSVKQHAIENQIAVMTADDAVHRLLQVGGRTSDAIREWHRVYHEVLRIARRPDVGNLSR